MYDGLPGLLMKQPEGATRAAVTAVDSFTYIPSRKVQGDLPTVVDLKSSRPGDYPCKSSIFEVSTVILVSIRL